MKSKWQQLDLLSFNDQQPEKTKNKPSYTITHDPIAGYKVVLAPGLTTGNQRNPCLSCPDFGKDMDSCATECSLRSFYLNQVGVPLVAAVSGDGLYSIVS